MSVVKISLHAWLTLCPWGYSNCTQVRWHKNRECVSMALLVCQQLHKRALLFLRIITIAPFEDFAENESQLKAKNRSNFEALPSRRCISFLGLP